MPLHVRQRWCFSFTKQQPTSFFLPTSVTIPASLYSAHGFPWAETQRWNLRACPSSQFAQGSCMNFSSTPDTPAKARKQETRTHENFIANRLEKPCPKGRLAKGTFS